LLLIYFLHFVAHLNYFHALLMVLFQYCLVRLGSTYRFDDIPNLKLWKQHPITGLKTNQPLMTTHKKVGITSRADLRSARNGGALVSLI
jgi:hypothetical protein